MGRRSKKQLSSLSDTEMYSPAPALCLVRLGEIRVPGAGTEDACLRGKGVTSGESWGVASRLGATGTTGKATLVRGWLTESKLSAQGLQLLGLRWGRCESRRLWFPVVSPGMTVTPRGVGMME